MKFIIAIPYAYIQISVVIFWNYTEIIIFCCEIVFTVANSAGLDTSK